ncbi:DUF5671 domain-containing protein [Pseudarthrobacter cellobiosi]|uniref:DUF5671 domain-containing protein n=1 Tax=Pseudarthrobacter cellobiosi TaxID=2953654 RepID=UPI00208E1F26|nr:MULTISPECIES: DUF5671 domain-containing protein [unclassified Pseudarthrobacter]MCO4254175.1 DUF5671 domain-containing protein [Pseudarthrobacter sp. HLT1-5]MCO4272887.1 DUF5671 domain-containing protein [Pseudarthrobacter sp. HLT3-5]
MTFQVPTTVSTAGSAQLTLRRLILYVLLFALVMIAAVGISGLLERLFSSAAVLASTDVAGLARSLAFTLIGGPLAGLLWWVVWKRLDDGAERTTAGWGLYLTGVYAVSLISAVTALLGMAASFIGRVEPQWYSPLSNGLVWAGIWIWHHWMWRHPVKHPVNLDDVPAVIGTVFGLLVGTFATITALGGLLDVAIRGQISLTPGVEAWWQPVLRALVWAVGGSIVWWWHWFRGGGRKLETTLVDVALVGVGIFAAGITALAGAGVVFFVLLRTAFDRGDPMTELLAPLGPAIAAAAVGALVWRYHRVSGARRSVATRRAVQLVTSGVALAAAASGVGVVINASLAMAVSPLAGGGTRTLLLGGISSLIVGGPVWWQAWKPTRQLQSADAIPPGRRVYLIVFFGISAVVALIALLVIGYRLFEFLLGDVTGGSLLDRIRTPLGLLVAAGFVAAYHFALWRREHVMAAASPPRAHTIDQVTLVTASSPEPLSKAITDVTGAKVTVWRRADAAQEKRPTDGALPAEHELVEQVLVEQVLNALAGVTAKRILLVIGPAAGQGTGIDVIPLETTR